MMQKINISILMPVYNEAKTIERLISEIDIINEDFSMIIIDDDSQDGTREVIEKIKYKFNLHHHIRKNERGYGSALMYGFNQAKDSDIVITMDADLSHNPSDIPSFIAEIKNGYDVVIGSRYIKGGKIQAWPLLRRITSRMANIVVAFCLRTNIKDNTSGYRAYSRKAVDKLLGKISSKGYSVLEEILYRAKEEGLKCREIPITFANRKEGVSKAKMIKEASGLFSLILALRRGA